MSITVQNITKWRIYCDTDSQWEVAVAVNPITTCPINAGHTVNANSVSEVEDAIGVGLTGIAYTASEYPVVLADTTAGNMDITMPVAATVGLDVCYWTRRDVTTNSLTLLPGSTDTINGATGGYVVDASNNNRAILKSDGISNWSLGTPSLDENQLLAPRKHYNSNLGTLLMEKGDIPTLTDTGVGRLPKGNDNQLMVYDSTQATGITWKANNLQNSTDYMWVASMGSQSTTTTTFVDKTGASITTSASFPGGNYRIGLTFISQISGGGAGTQPRVQVVRTDTSAVMFNIIVPEASTKSQDGATSHFCVVSMPAGARTYKVQFARFGGNNGNTVQISMLVFEFAHSD